METPLVSILMPTYNDAEYILDAINSIFSQTYQRWQLIIIDDGSTDDTEEQLTQWIADQRVQYLKLERNHGQLNALSTGVSHICGDYVTFLHSDDVLSSENSLENLVLYLQQHDCDGVFADIIKMDRTGRKNNVLNTVSHVDQDTVAGVFALGGSNCVSDIFFLRTTVFFSTVKDRYINWNMPYWFFRDSDGIKTLKLDKVDPWYCYRIYEENYIHSNAGKFEASNGCLRTILDIAQCYDLVLLPFSRALAYLSLKLFNRSFVLYHEQPYSSPYRDLVFSVFSRYYSDDELKNHYISSVIEFYSHYPSNRIIHVPAPLVEKCQSWYTGRDARLFYRDLKEKNLDPLYTYLLKEASSGFGKIIIEKKENRERLYETLKFLNLQASVSLPTGISPI